MALAYLYPTSDQSNTFGEPLLTSHYLEIDENYVDVDTAPGSNDGDSSKIAATGSGQVDRFGLNGSAFTTPYSGNSVTQVDVFFSIKGSTTGMTITPFLYLSGSTSNGTSQSAGTGSYTEYSQTITRPGGGSWTASDIGSLQVGVTSGGTYGKLAKVYVSQIYVRVTHSSSSNHPAPTSLECDYQTNPTSGVSEYPSFTCIAETNGSETIDDAYIEIYEEASMTTQVADSGWIDITNVTDGNRTEVIEYDGGGAWTQADYLKSGQTYYWRIKLRDTAGTPVESEWSTLNTFYGAPLKRQWHLSNYNQRKILKFTDDHAAASAGLVIPIDFQSGLREAITNDGCFNEATQASGGFQIESYKNKTYLTYLAKPTVDNAYGIHLIVRDDDTGAWGDPIYIMPSSTSDTHNFPVICIDGDGYIHIIKSGHYSANYYTRSENIEDTSSWIYPPNDALEYHTVPNGGSATYPILFYVPAKDRLYLIYRLGTFSASYSYAMQYSDDNGVTWSTQYNIINDTHAEHYRVYLYGLRYDKTRDRLHISWTYNHYYDDGDTVSNSENSLGIWYAYSDLDDTYTGSPTTHGFNVWRESDGSIIGYTGTSPIGNSNSTTTGWNQAKAQAIVYAPDQESSGFTETMVLDRLGKPVIFWEQKARVGLPTTPFHPATEWTDLCCATWDSDIGFNGSWVNTYISQDINEMLRVRRSSCSVATDIDGIIHCYFPVGSISYWRTTPTADVDNINNTPSTGSTNYNLLDDGATYLDNSEYVTMGASTSKMSFTHSGTIPSNYTILAVEIEAIAKRNSGTSTLNGYVEISSVEYDCATSQSCSTDIPYWFRFEWTENPATTSAWTTSDINSLTFGLKDTATGSIDIYRVVLRVKVTESSNSEYVSNEIIYIQSYDNGVTWEVVNKSLNSGEGLPMMNHAHHLTPDEVYKLCWSSGHKIFYLDNTIGVFSDVRSDGKDVRVYYGDTEIDRVFDYVDKNTSKMFIKLQGSIDADSEWADKDYIIYFDYPDESTEAQSNPNNIYKFFEGWESFEDGDVITGDGWTFNSGSGQIYGSPPDHNNKVHGGNCAFETSACDAEKSILTAETNVIIEFGLWSEGGTANVLGIEDGSGNRVGVGYTGSYGGIYDGSSYLDANGTSLSGTKQLSGAQMHEYKMFLNNNGLTAWADGQEICREYSVTPTTVDKIYMACNGTSYYDFIRVSNSYEEVSDTNITFSSWYWAALAYDSDGSSTNGVWDAKEHNFTGVGFTVTVDLFVPDTVTVSGSAYFRLYVCTGATYDATKIISTNDFTITVDASGTKSGSSPYIILDPDTTYSFKLDWYDIDYSGGGSVSVASTTKYVLKAADVFNPSFVEVDTEVRGMRLLSKLVGRGRSRFYYKYDISETKIMWQRHLNVENTGFIQDAIRELNIEFLHASDSENEIPVESIGALNLVTDYLVELLSNQNRITRHPIEWVVPVDSENEIPIEYTEARSIENVVPVSYFGFVTSDVSLNIDWSGVFSYTKEAPISFIEFRSIGRELVVEHTFPIVHDTEFPVSYKGALEVIDVLPIEVQQIVDTASADAPIEYTISQYPFVASLPIDITKFAGRVGSFPISYTGVIGEISLNVFPIDFTVSFSDIKDLPAEVTTAETFSRYLNIDYMSNVIESKEVNIEWLQLFGSESTFPISHTIKTGAIIRTIPIAYTHKKQIVMTLPVSYKGTMVSINEFPVDYITGFPFEIANEFVIDWTTKLQQQTYFPVSFTSGVEIVSVTPFPIEYKGASTFGINLNIDVLSNRNVVAHFNIENQTFMTLGTSLNVDYLIQFMLETGIPISHLGALILSIILEDVNLKKAGITNWNLFTSNMGLGLSKPNINNFNLLVPDNDIEISKTKIINPNQRGGRSDKE